MTIMSKEKKQYPPGRTGKNEMCNRFWQGLIERSKKRTPLFADLSPKSYDNFFLRTGAGVRGLQFSYRIPDKYVSIQLYIWRGTGMKKDSKKVFDQLHQNKEDIERNFGGDLEWQRRDDAPVSYISKRIDWNGLKDEESWPEIQERMIDEMINLEKAFRKHLDELRIE